MRQSFLRRRRVRYSLSSFLLLVLALRALVPAGYMPAMDGRFALQLCPDGLPAVLLESTQAADHVAQGLHSGHHLPHEGSHHGPSFSQHCIFAAALGVAAPMYMQPAVVLFEPLLAAHGEPEHLIHTVQRLHVQQPRAPPALS